MKANRISSTYLFSDGKETLLEKTSSEHFAIVHYISLLLSQARGILVEDCLCLSLTVKLGDIFSLSYIPCFHLS